MIAACIVPSLLLRFGGKMDFSQTVVYEANIRAMGPEANFRGLAGRLDAIRALGVNALWLMPVQPVGQIKSAGGLGSPYAVADFSAVNPEFGTADDLRAIVKGAHRRGMVVILDWVADHSAWDNPWVRIHPDWYLHDRNGQIAIPPGTGWNDVAALDYTNRDMRRAMVEAMRGWLVGYDIDGFRCDAADRMPVDFWREAISTLRKSSDRVLLMLAEGDRREDYTAGFDLAYGWDFNARLREIFAGKAADQLREGVAQEARKSPDPDQRLRFATDHDISAWEGSLSELYKSSRGARAAFGLAALYGGVPLIYTGEEVDWPQRIPIFGDTTIDWAHDPATTVWMEKLLNVRANNLALQKGSLLDRSTQNVVIFERRRDSNAALVIANVRGEPEQVDAPGRGTWRDGFTGQAVNLDSPIRLEPYEFRVFLRNSAL